MPLNLLLAGLIAVPAVAALIVLILGLARRATRAVIYTVAGAGTLLSAVGLLILAPYAGTPTPLLTSLAGSGGWLGLTVRVDAAAEYAGLGLTILVVPLLVWLVWHVTRASDEGEHDSQTSLAREWGAVASVMALESAALLAVFSDNLIWVGAGWALAALFVWWTGEAGTEMADIDRAGLLFLLAGPLLWLAVMAFVASPTGSPLLFNLTGSGKFTMVDVAVLAIVLALAGGAYPFGMWIRRRAVMASPAGIGALALVAVPLAILMMARTYGVASSSRGAWPQFGNGTPPLTIGILLALFGMLTVGSAGMLALGRRDARALIALLAMAQSGWGMIVTGTGDPNALPGGILLLATTVLGLGAMIASAALGSTLGDTVERDGAGPRAFGEPLRLPVLLAWCAGAATLVGMPLFGGFVPREIATGAALQSGTLLGPLAGVAWAGDALLLLALIRATAPAFSGIHAFTKDDLVETEDDDLSSEPETEDVGDEEAGAVGVEPATLASARDVREIPAVVFGTLALLVGIAPQALLSGGAVAAATAIIGQQQVNAIYDIRAIGYGNGMVAWLPALAWLAAAIFAIMVMVLVPARDRMTRPVTFTAGETLAEEAPAEMAGMAEPADAWRDLASTMRSAIVLPGSRQLVEPVESGDAGPEDEEEPEELEEPEEPESAEAAGERAKTEGVRVTSDSGNDPGDKAGGEA